MTLFINSKKLGVMIDSTHKIFTDEDIEKISSTVNKWRIGKNYEDIKGFCKSAKTKEIVENNYFLTPARYIDIEDKNEKEDLFDERFLALKNEYLELQNNTDNLSNDLLSILKKINKD